MKPVRSGGRRRESAAETRRLILCAALELFSSSGYDATTVGEIAQRAGVAPATVYTSVGAKPRLLVTLLADGARDDDIAETMRRVARGMDGGSVVRALTAGTRRGNETYRALLDVSATIGRAHRDVGEATRAALDSYRDNLGLGADRLATLRALRPGMSRDRAADVLWWALGPHSWRALVIDDGWSWDRAERWLEAELSRTLLRDTPA